jgi:hypothetical protein
VDGTIRIRNVAGDVEVALLRNCAQEPGRSIFSSGVRGIGQAARRDFCLPDNRTLGNRILAAILAQSRLR